MAPVLSRPVPARGRRPALRRQILAFAAFVCVALAGVVGVQIAQERHSALRTAQGEAELLARALSEHAARSIGAVDVLLEQIVDRLENVRRDVSEGRDEPLVILGNRSGMPQVVSVGFIGPDGVLQATRRGRAPPGIRLSERDYFAVHRRGGWGGIFVGIPAPSWVDGRLAFSVSRRVNTPDGRFAGVVAALIDPAYFQGYYDSVATQAVHGFALWSDAGTIVASSSSFSLHADLLPHDSALVSEAWDLRTGRFTRAVREARADREPVVAAVHDVPGLPLSIIALATSDDVLAAWRVLVLRLAVSGLLVFAGIAAFGVFAIRAAGREEIAMRRLERADAELRRRVADLEETRAHLEEKSAALARMADGYASAREKADAATRAKSEFLANMSHELRTPLNAILGFSEILRDETFGPLGSTRYAGYARDIHASGRLLLDLINDILDLSKIEAGKLELKPEQIDPAAVIADAVRLVRHGAAAAGLRIRVELPRSLPEIVVDRRAVHQMLLNLLANAIKFTPSGGEVTVSALAEPAGFSITVRDTGIGIPEHDLERVLEPFEQAISVSQPTSGTGLGLSLVKSLMKAHGGSLRLASRVAAGTAATLEFPASVIVRQAA